MLTIFAAGFGDPCLGCSGAACDVCGGKVQCRFLAFDRVLDTQASCLRGADGQCDRSQLVCSTPLGATLRGNIVSLEPFFVAVSVSTNGQQFFPVKGSGAAFNVNDPACTDTLSVNCAFKFKYYEQPIIASITPSLTAGDGNGRVTITGSNFLNVNDLRCRFGDKVKALPIPHRNRVAFARGQEMKGRNSATKGRVVCMPTSNSPEQELTILSSAGWDQGVSVGLN